jgi:hypothetical protein
MYIYLTPSNSTGILYRFALDLPQRTKNNSFVQHPLLPFWEMTVAEYKRANTP